MRYKHLKNADVDVSVIGVGTWSIGAGTYGDVEDQQSVAAIRAMIDNGVNLIDTAPAYGGGRAEKVVGEAIKGYDRSKLLISTKCAIGTTTLSAKRCLAEGKDPFTQGPGRDATFENILYECEQSLRRLGTDYVDFLFIHWPDPVTPYEETAKAFNYLKKEGKVRFVGLSNFNEEQIMEFEKYCKVDVIQPPYSMVVRRDEELIKWAYERGIDSMTYGSLGAGILTGTFREVPTFGERDPRNGFYPFFKEPYFSQVMELLKVMDGVSEELGGKPLAQITINWTTQKDYISMALCGVRTPAEAVENCAAFDWSLNEDQMKRISEAVEKYCNFGREIAH